MNEINTVLQFISGLPVHLLSLVAVDNGHFADLNYHVVGDCKITPADK